MRPALGFSVGDFISAPGMHRSLIPLNLKLLLSLTKLVRKITNALQKTAGASSQYQHIFHGLNDLYIILQLLEQIEHTEEHASHLNAIRGIALACQLPLRDFLTKVEKYESSLGPFSTQNGFRATGRKAQRVVIMDDDS
jgi:hypothetical protein